MISKKRGFLNFIKFPMKFLIIIWCTIGFYTLLSMCFTSRRSGPIIVKDSFIVRNKTDLNKYILVWTSIESEPIMNLGSGTNTFIQRKCPNTNCFVISDKSDDDVATFDAIIFHGPELRKDNIPKVRSLNQKYVFASMESSQYYPVCDKIFNNFFNWTWTYKLNSDLNYEYITIRNKEGSIIGPKEIMHWKKLDEMKPIDDKIKSKLHNKTIAAAWFASNCNTPGKREIIVNDLIKELEKFNLKLDVYGKCGNKNCPRSRTADCLKKLETDYYFYLSFENSISNDYVTEKLLHALQHYTIPVVYGGANYSRFMPDGIYLDMNKFTVPELAKQMAYLINDKEEYYKYFKWHNHYSYHEITDSPESDPYCKLCSMMNDNKDVKKPTIHNNFVEWWSQNQCKMF